MVSDLDIYRSANLLIEQHGDGAALEADMKADARLEAGDTGEAWFWRQVLKAVRELQNAERPTDAAVH